MRELILAALLVACSPHGTKDHASGASEIPMHPAERYRAYLQSVGVDASAEVVRIPGERASEALGELAEHEAEVSLRVEIVHALATRPDDGAASALEQRAAHDADDSVRKLARTYLSTRR